MSKFRSISPLVWSLELLQVCLTLRSCSLWGPFLNTSLFIVAKTLEFCNSISCLACYRLSLCSLVCCQLNYLVDRYFIRQMFPTVFRLQGSCVSCQRKVEGTREVRTWSCFHGIARNSLWTSVGILIQGLPAWIFDILQLYLYRRSNIWIETHKQYFKTGWVLEASQICMCICLWQFLANARTTIALPHRPLLLDLDSAHSSSNLFSHEWTRH